MKPQTYTPIFTPQVDLTRLPAISAPVSTGLKVIIFENGIAVDRTNFVYDGSGGNPVTFSRIVYQRGTASMIAIIDPSNTWLPVVGWRIEIWTTARREFAGTISDWQDQYLGNDGFHHIQVNCTSLEVSYDILIPPRSYINRSTDFIVRDLIGSLASRVPISIGQIDSGPVVPIVTYSFDRLSDTLTALANIAGQVWYVDPEDLTVQMHKPTAKPAPFVLFTPEVQWETIDFHQTRQDYRNRQIVRGSFQLNQPSNVMFAGDGSTKIFTLPYIPDTVLSARTTNGVQATATGTFSGQPSPGDSVTIGTSTAILASKRTITVDHTQCGTADSTNFPLLVSISDPTLRTVANGGSVQSGSAFDILFYSDAGSTLLNWEIETYDPVGGSLIAWVQIPTLSHTIDTVIYMYWGCATISSFQGSPNAAWDSNYEGVWHLANGSTLSAADSTSNNSGGSLSSPPPLPTVGQVDGGMSSTPSFPFRFISAGPYSQLQPSTAVSVECWIYIADANGFTSHPISVTPPGVFANGYAVLFDGTSTIQFFVETGIIPSGVSTTISIGAWHHVVGTYDGSTVRLYVDGILAGTLSASNALGSDPTSILRLGGWDGFSGLMDEIRISNVARAASWVTASYNGQKTGSTMLTLSAISSGGTVAIREGYTFVAALDNTQPFEVLIGATAAATAQNLVDAINANPATAGVLYSLPTIENPSCNADAPSGSAFTLRVKIHGAAGNSAPALSKICPNFAWSGATCSGGSDGTSTSLNLQQDFLWLKGDQTVTCLNAVAGGTSLEVSYYRLGGDCVAVENTAQVQLRAVLEGGTGQYQQLLNDSSNTSYAAILQEAQQTLAQFSVLTSSFAFKTYQIGLSPGDLLTLVLTNPTSIYNGQWQIQRIDGAYVPQLPDTPGRFLTWDEMAMAWDQATMTWDQTGIPATGCFLYTVTVVNVVGAPNWISEWENLIKP